MTPTENSPSEIQRLLRCARGKNVYLAHDRELDSQVAIDIFSDNNSMMPDGLTVSAWEARVLGRLGNHQNIATVIDRWENDEAAVMVTRYLPGGSLQDRIVRSRESGEGLPLDLIESISTEIAHGLAYIHGCRILYRDLQPRNVLFDEWGTVRLVDFDTAVSLDAPCLRRPRLPRPGNQGDELHRASAGAVAGPHDRDS